MFVLRTSRYVAPVKFTLFVPLYRIVFAKLAHKFAPFIALASLHFREASFRAANAAASVVSKSAQIQTARAGQICKFNPSKATISAWLCRDGACWRSSWPR